MSIRIFIKLFGTFQRIHYQKKLPLHLDKEYFIGNSALKSLPVPNFFKITSLCVKNLTTFT
ncbi:uncharacterized protein METZ01_LOCUS337793, partial [marine metagenome]